MAVYKRILIALVIFLSYILVSAYFVNTDIKERAIVLGVALDYDNGFEIACEVVVPSSEDTQTGGGGARKILTGRGETVSIAFQSLNTYNGYLFSLGQCNLIAICKNLLLNRNVSDVLAYFAFSDAFKDGVTVAACESSPQNLFEAQLPIDSYVSLAAHNAIRGNGSRINVPDMDILKFVKAQSTLLGGSYLPYITLEDDRQPNVQPDDKASQKRLAIRSMAVFQKGDLKGFLDEDQLKSFNIVSDEKAFHVFSVKDTLPDAILPRTIAVGNLSKSVETSYSLKEGVPSISVQLNMEIKRLRTDTDGVTIPFQPITDREITGEISRQVQNECLNRIEDVYRLLISLDCDILDIYSGFYKSLGKEWEAFVALNPDWWDKLAVSAFCKAV